MGKLVWRKRLELMTKTGVDSLITAIKVRFNFLAMWRHGHCHFGVDEVRRITSQLVKMAKGPLSNT